MVQIPCAHSCTCGVDLVVFAWLTAVMQGTQLKDFVSTASWLCSLLGCMCCACLSCCVPVQVS
jgi:hypothetical protein